MLHLLQLAILFLLLQALQQRPHSALAEVLEWPVQHPCTSWLALLQATCSNRTTCEHMARATIDTHLQLWSVLPCFDLHIRQNCCEPQKMSDGVSSKLTNFHLANLCDWHKLATLFIPMHANCICEAIL